MSGKKDKKARKSKKEKVRGSIFQGAKNRLSMFVGMNTSSQMSDHDGTGTGDLYDGAYNSAGLPHGRGVLYHVNGEKQYEGKFRDGKFHGKGQHYYPSGRIEYEGEFFCGLCQGNGRQYFQSGGVKYEGPWHSNRYGEGIGKLFYEAVSVVQFEGMFVNGQPEGPGKMYFESGALRCDGPFVKGRLHGNNATCYAPGGTLEYHGQFSTGHAHGHGIAYNSKGEKSFEGMFTLGQPTLFDVVVWWVKSLCGKNDMEDGGSMKARKSTDNFGLGFMGEEDDDETTRAASMRMGAVQEEV